MRLLLRSLTAAAACSVVLCALPALAQAPALNVLKPSGAPPGNTVDVTLEGGNLNGATTLWTSFPCTVTLPKDIEKNGQEAGKVVFRLQVPADAPLGIHGVRVATDKGISNLRLFVIDDLPASPETEPNNSPGDAQELQLPAAVDGVAEAEQYDYYKIRAKEGQRLAIEVLARRLGSPMDPILRLLDQQGRELAYNDDEAGIGSDCRLVYTFPSEGDYLLEVRDIRFQGGGNYVYRLRVADFPAVAVPYPMGGRKGAHITVEFAGDHPEGIEPVELKVPDDPWAGAVSLGARAAGGSAAGFVRFALGAGREALEAEPNDLADQATRVELPVTLNGRLARPGDRDRFSFAGKKGQRFVFRARTRELGSPSDLTLTLHGADGKQLAQADDSGKNDAVIDHTFAADGEYLLAVEDLLGRGGPAFAYRIEAAPYRPGFDLSLAADKVDVLQGGVASLEVQVARRDYNGPIALKVDGLPEGITAAGGIVAPGQKQTFLTLQGADDVARGQALSLRVLGTAKINDEDVTEQAVATEVLAKALSNLSWPPQSLVGTLAAGVGPKPFFTLSTEEPRLAVGTGAAVRFRVKAGRAEDFKDAVALSLAALPEKVTAEAGPVPAEQNEVELVLRAAGDAPQGTYTVLVNGKAKFNDKEITQPAPALAMEVRPAFFQLKAESGEGKLAQGGKLAVKVAAARNGYDGPITLSLANLPEGVSAPGEVSIPEGQNEVEIEVSAADDAKVGNADKVSVVGKAPIGSAVHEAAAPNVTVNVLEKPKPKKEDAEKKGDAAEKEKADKPNDSGKEKPKDKAPDAEDG